MVCTKRSHILKQTWSWKLKNWKLQVCLSACDLLVDNKHQRVKSFIFHKICYDLLVHRGLVLIMHISWILIDCCFYTTIWQSDTKTTGGSRTAATSKMEHFVIIVNGWKRLAIISKRSILDVAAVLDPPLQKRLLKCREEEVV